MKDTPEKVKLLARDLRNGKEFPRGPRGGQLPRRPPSVGRGKITPTPLDQRWLKFAEIDYSVRTGRLSPPARPTTRLPRGLVNRPRNGHVWTSSSATAWNVTCV